MNAEQMAYAAYSAISIRDGDEPMPRDEWHRCRADGSLPRIQRVRVVRLPDGSEAGVNRFDYNLAHACDTYVQLHDGAWIKARKLVIVDVEPEGHRP